VSRDLTVGRQEGKKKKKRNTGPIASTFVKNKSGPDLLLRERA